MKSSMSWMLPTPGNVIPLQTLKPRMQGIDSTRMATRLTSTAFLRLQPNRSIAKAMMFSKTAMIVVSAANVMNTKNSEPKKRPPAIWLNRLGSVTNTRPGPSPALTPNAEHAGKMIRPAVMATNVSRHTTLIASPVRLRSRPM